MFIICAQLTFAVFLQLTSPNIKTEWSHGFDDACYFIAGQIEIKRSLIVAMYQMMFCLPAQHRKKLSSDRKHRQHEADLLTKGRLRKGKHNFMLARNRQGKMS